MKYRKSLLAFTCALPLVLTACGKDDGGSENNAQNNAAESASTAASSESKPNSEKPSESSDPEDKDKASKDNHDGQSGKDGNKPGDDPAKNAEGDRGGNRDNSGRGESTDSEPGASGQPGRGGNGAPGGASAGDSQAITNLIQGMGKQRSAYDFLNYSLDHSCQSYISSQGGEKTIRANNNTIKAMGPEGNKAIPVPSVKSVNDIKVNGDNATARVTASYGNKAPQTESMSFARENGKWTLCPS